MMLKSEKARFNSANVRPNEEYPDYIHSTSISCHINMLPYDYWWTFLYVLNRWGHNRGIQLIQLSQINSSVPVVQRTHNAWECGTCVQRQWKQAKKLNEWLKLPFERRQGAIHNFLSVSAALNMCIYPQNVSSVLTYSFQQEWWQQCMILWQQVEG